MGKDSSLNDMFVNPFNRVVKHTQLAHCEELNI